MTALLTDNLPLLAGAPNGIQKLRELILELAVRGKLVPQDPADEPASELLKRIAEEKARLVAEGKIRKQKTLAEIDEEEKPFELPEGWEWARLGEVSAYIQRGKGPAYVEKSGFRVVSQKCVRWSGLDLDPARYIDPESIRKYEEVRFLCQGDILWNSTGTGTIGRACVVDGLPGGNPLVADSHVTVVRPVGVLSRFLWRLIQSPGVQSEIEGGASGTTNQIELNTSTVIAHLVPIPPLAEQHRIVAKVDELMALCDRLEARQADAESAHARLVQTLFDSLTQASDADDFAASWQRLAEHFHSLFTSESSIDALKQTLLQLAVMGKLVPQDPSDEPVDTWLENHPGRTSKIRRGIPEDVVMDEWIDKFPVLASWAKMSTAQLLRANAIIDVKDGNHGANHPVKGDWSEEGLPFITAAQVSGFSIDYDSSNKISGAPLKRLRVGFSDPGDVIYTHKGSVGRTAINTRSCVLSPQTTYYRLNSEILFNRYLMYFFQSDFFTRQVDGVKGQTTRDFVSITQQYLFFILIPPVKEQHRIVAKLDQLMSLCDQLKARLINACQLHERLANALVEQAVA